jgi:hypothetical protein
MSDLKTVDPIDELEDKLKEHKKWVNLVMLTTGQTCYGCLTYDTEKDARDKCRYATMDYLFEDCPENLIIRGYTLPNRAGTLVTYTKSQVITKFPVPV